MRARLVIFGIVCGLSCASACAADNLSEPTPAGQAKNPDNDDKSERTPQWNVEIKRQNTDHATAGETTNTTLRLEAYPSEGLLAMLRLDVPFPDDRTTFAGDPFHPHLGDISIRAQTQPVKTAGLPLSAYLELAFPTANPKTLGRGKYLVILGTETSLPVGGFSLNSVTHKIWFEPSIEQDASVAGDDDFTDINYTKLELGVRDAWRNYTLKLTLKAIVDWENAGETGGVAELEGGMRFGRGWLAKLMIGHRAWGSSVPSTYGTRVELTLGHVF